MAGAGKGKRIIANKGRKLQVAPTSRKLFGRELQEVFLEHFAANTNTVQAAKAAGVAYSTVYRKRASCPAFAAAWNEALGQGYDRLEEAAVREAIEALKRPPRVRTSGKTPAIAPMDPVMALQLLREHKRGLAGIAKPGRMPTVASNAELHAALIARLKAFGIRVREERKSEGKS